MKEDERDLWQSFGAGTEHQYPRDAGVVLCIPEKRVNYLCMKWAKQGCYEYGVVCDLGWKVQP